MCGGFSCQTVFNTSCHMSMDFTCHCCVRFASVMDVLAMVRVYIYINCWVVIRTSCDFEL